MEREIVLQIGGMDEVDIRHGIIFDIVDDSGTSRAIIRQATNFLKQHLLTED